MFAHVHATARGYFAHAGGWFELVNKEATGTVGTGTERYNIGPVDATSLKVTGITTLGIIGISTGRIIGPSVTYIDPATVGAAGTVVILGNLQVDGTQTTVNSSVMTVTDKNIEVAKGAANNAAADGAGITVDAGSNADKTWQWLDATDSWTSSEHIRIPDDKVFGFASDTNTYVGRPAADTIAFTNGGSERVRIASDGKVGIGTVPLHAFEIFSGSDHENIIQVKGTNPAGVYAGMGVHQGNVVITGGGIGSNSAGIIFRTALNGTEAEKLRITSTGQVVIGTTIPGDSGADDLTIATSTNTGITVRSGTTSKGSIYFSDTTAANAQSYVGYIQYNHGDNSLTLATNASQKVRIDSSGNTNIV